MAVPNTTTFSLQDVQTELGGVNDDLVECFANASASGFDPLYEGSKNSLLNFRNYNAVGSLPLLRDSVGATGTSFSVGASLVVGASDTLLFLVVSGYTSLGTIGVSDTAGATWTHFSTPNTHQSIYYTSDTSTTGSRTVTVTHSGAFYSSLIVGALEDSPTTLTGTPVSTVDTSPSALTISHNYTPRSVNSLMLSFAFSSHNASGGTWISVGSGQSVFETASAGGSVYITLNGSQENTGSTSVDAQSFTNASTVDNKRLITFDIVPI